MTEKPFSFSLFHSLQIFSQADSLFSAYCRLVFLLAGLDIIFYYFDQFFITHACSIHTEIIVLCIVPFSSCMIFAIIIAEFVEFLDFCFCFLHCTAILSHYSFDGVFLWCIEEQFDDMVIILQNKICCTSDDDTGFFFCQFLDDLSLNIKQIIIRYITRIIRRENFTAVNFSFSSE